MQISTSPQTDNHASTPPLSLLHGGCSSNQQRQSTDLTFFKSQRKESDVRNQFELTLRQLALKSLIAAKMFYCHFQYVRFLQL